MIKILFFVENLTEGGAEKVLRNLVNNMDQSRFDITVQTVWPCDAKKYLVEGVHYKSVCAERSRTNALRYRVEAALGITYNLHVKDDYDIECAYLECGATKVMASSANKKAKKLAWVHCDLKKAMSDPQGFAVGTRKYYEKFDKVICVSKNVQDSFRELFGDGIPTELVYNTVDDDEIKQKALLPLPDGIKMPPMTVVSLGRLSAPKKYMRLLKAHKRLLNEGVEHNVWILGEGPDRTELEKFIDDNKLSETAKLLGFFDNPYPFLREAELLACSSEYEGFSTFVTEGVILGKSIVTTDCGGMREILGDSEYGLICDNSENGIYEGLKAMLTDEKLRADYAAKAVKRGRDFSTQSLVSETERYFENILGESIND